MSENINESLIFACSEFDLARVKDLIAKGADPNYRRSDEEGGLSALHECCISGSEAVEIIQYLLSLKTPGDDSEQRLVNVNIVDENGIPPLAFAISTQNIQVIKLLHENGAKLCLPEFVATVAGATSPDVITFLLSTEEGKASVNAVDPDTGKTPALMATLASDSSEPARILFAAGADFGAVDRRGKNVLHLAAQNLGAGGEILRFLLANSPALAAKVASTLINQRDLTDVGFTPLLEAAASANAEVMEMLLNLGADMQINSLPTHDSDDDDDEEQSGDDDEAKEKLKELTCGDVLEGYAATLEEGDIEEAERVRACLKLLVKADDE